MDNLSTKRSVSAQETTIQDENSKLESRYECPICINWLNEPLLTSCGHRFCRKCITSWLKKQNKFCPIDNKPLNDNDIFPDNFTRREILQLRKPCPNAEMGCPVNLSPLELDAHWLHCEFQQKTLFDCAYKKYGCLFQSNTKSDFDTHESNEVAAHLKLLESTCDRSNIFTAKAIESTEFWDAPSKSHRINGDVSAEQTDARVKSLYERIVVLEQQKIELQLRVDKLIAQRCGGILIWKIIEFQKKIDAMSIDPNVMFYSPEAYTSEHGYRFCGRINISPKVKDNIGLHIHLMRSENDYHLDWPFMGRIKISMIHHNSYETQHDTIMSKPEILAFHRPLQEISPRGFGYLEYASITDILRKGFIMDDTLTIKIQMNIV